MIPPPLAETLVNARAVARSLAETALGDEERIQIARSFCHTIVSAWWRFLTAPKHDPALRPLLEAVPFKDLPQSAVAVAESIGAAAAASEPETAAYNIGLLYTGMLPQAYRAAFGVYYTPPPLAARLIDQATIAGVDWTCCKVLDPACGGGTFLAPVAKRMIAAMSEAKPDTIVGNVAARLHGYEVDPFAAWLSQVTLDAVMLPLCRKAGRQPPEVVTVRDSLRRCASSERYDLIIGNPPYGRVKLTPEDRARYRRSLYGHANLYGLFTDLALRHARPGGVIAYVTPTSFLAGEYFKNLRALLGREAPPVTVDFVAARKGVFEDVLQETLLATYRRGIPPKPAQAHEVMLASGKGLQAVETGRFFLPDDPSQPWLLPRTPEHAALIERLRAMPHRLADWGYTVSTGPLVWNRHKKQLRSSPGQGRFPLIWAESVMVDGRFVFRAEKKNHEPYFEPLAGDEWLITRTPCVLLQRTTAKEQNRRLIAAVLPESFLVRHRAVVIENHLNMLRPIVERPKVSPAVLAAFLNSAAADRAFRCVSGSVAVSAYELESLPLPDPTALDGLAELVRRCASRASLEAECERLYAFDAAEAA